jgi:hypothetical protein
MAVRRAIFWLCAAILLAAAGYFLLTVLANYGIGFTL